MGMSKSQEHLLEERNHLIPPPPRERAHVPNPAVRQSDLPVSMHGMNQESSQNKHNRPAKGAPKH